MCKYNDVSRKISPKAIDFNCFRAYLSFFVISRVTLNKFEFIGSFYKFSFRRLDNTAENEYNKYNTCYITIIIIKEGMKHAAESKDHRKDDR